MRGKKLLRKTSEGKMANGLSFFGAGALASVVLLASTAGNAATHNHCAVVPWGPESTSSFVPALPLDYRPGGNVSGLNALLSSRVSVPVPAATVGANCLYEISDITSITFNFTFEGVMEFGEGFTEGDVEDLTPDPDAAAGSVSYTFTSGVDNVQAIQPHLGTNPNQFGPYEFNALAGPVSFFERLQDDNDGFLLTAGKVSYKGNHYYLPEIPLPASLTFLTTALASFGLLRAGRKRVA